MPHNPGFLGVCFGNVITANSPAAQGGNAENWQDVLWHEFCHVITLGITHNKMPRWLSEGISVYEERQASPVWGMRMNPRNREMILGTDLTPVSQLSSAFMTPKSPYHVQFAYYESSLVVECIVQKYGFNSLRQILTDLGNGVNINEAIAKNTEPMKKFEADFAAYAKQQALNLGPGLDWTRPEAADDGGGAPDFEAPHTNTSDIDVIKHLLTRRSESTNAASTAAAGTNGPSNKPNYWKLVVEARTDLSNHQWEDAKVPLQKLIDLDPAQTGDDNAYALLAAAHRQLNETNEEREVLIKLASLQSDDTEGFGRLMELDAGHGDWKGVAENAERFLAVNPLVPEPYRQLARASSELGNTQPAIRANQRLLLLDPPDPADIHYQLARLMQKQGDSAGAKRNVMEALEEAPRFPDALALLLQLEGPATAK
jgi:tetratricopeptide (TPR) repeat protein